MRSLKNKPQVQAPTASYPFGRIKDDTGLDDGTPVNEDVYGDQHQFFETLMSDAGITPNEMPDNEYNGFQLINALKTLIGKLISTKSDKAQPSWISYTLLNGFASYTTTTPAFRITQENRLESKGAVFGTLSGSSQVIANITSSGLTTNAQVVLPTIDSSSTGSTNASIRIKATSSTNIEISLLSTDGSSPNVTMNITFVIPLDALK